MQVHEAQKLHNAAAAEAIQEACLAALMGTLPIPLGKGGGAEARRPLGLAVVGGLVVYITPVVYIYMEKFCGLFRRTKNMASVISTACPNPPALWGIRVEVCKFT